MTEQPSKQTDWQRLYSLFDKVRFGILCRRLEVLIVRGKHYAALSTFRSYLGQTSRITANMDSSLDDVFDVRLVNAIRKRGIATLQELDSTSDNDLYKIPVLGEKRVAQIRSIIERIKAGDQLETYGLTALEREELHFEFEDEA